MYSLALEIYEASTEENKSQYDLQKAQLYGLLGKDNLMIEKNIDYLLNNPNQKKIVYYKSELRNLVIYACSMEMDGLVDTTITSVPRFDTLVK